MQGLDKIFVDAHYAASGFGFNSLPSLGIKNLQTHRESVIHVRGRDDKNMGCASRDTDLTDAGSCASHFERSPVSFVLGTTVTPRFLSAASTVGRISSRSARSATFAGDSVTATKGSTA